MRLAGGIAALLVLATAACSSSDPSTAPAAPAAAQPATMTSAPDSPSATPSAFPTAGPVPAPVNNIVGGAMCVSTDAYWTDVNGHPEVQVMAAGPSNVSASFLGDSGPLGTTQAAEINEGMTGAHMVGSDVASSQVRAVSIAIAGAVEGSCVAPKV